MQDAGDSRASGMLGRQGGGSQQTEPSKIWGHFLVHFDTFTSKYVAESHTPSWKDA